MTLKNKTNTDTTVSKFTVLRISRAAFIALSKKRLDYMAQGKRKTCGEIASEILESV